MMRILKIFIFLILVLAIFTSEIAFADMSHELFTEVLRRYVEEGSVDYKNLCQDQRLPAYIQQLASTDPGKLTGREHQLAFWINAYNAYTLKIICDNYPLKSINELHTGGLLLGSALGRTVWHKKLVTINGELTSLDAIEHKILRPQFNEPRIHFAIVCAAKGCPPLRAEAYEAYKIDNQLDDQGKIFMAQQEKNKFDLDKKVANISPIFSWFKKDFGSRPEKVLEFLVPFLDEGAAQSIRADPKEWRIRYTNYDWSLNEQ